MIPHAKNAVTSLPSDGYLTICAIGASAGGVEALRSLFGQLPLDLGMAYVVILHLAPEHPSAMAEILSACTEMPVRQVDDTTQLNPNCVYVIPPDRELIIDGNSLAARAFSEPRGQRAPIDMFFRSVAAARCDGMAVVLTGSGSDGSSGARAIHEAGGVVFAQDPQDAEFPAMPQSVIATGIVNFVATIGGLVERLAEVARSQMEVRSLDADRQASDLRKIVELLRTKTGHDFANYKRATVMRRVLRRMQVCRVTNMDDYAELVRTTPEEAQALFDDLLISVTHFFRDEHAFEVLSKRIIPLLFEDVAEEGLRIWSVGCATGEEAYSLGILLLEEAARQKVHVPMQIFASDLDEGALAKAREGRFPRSIEADVTEERLQQFFIDEGSHYRVRKELRDIVLFASHSVLKDPPFLRMDLITCRNLLIYLERSLQEQLINVFHYGLRSDGCLFVGSAETADASSDLFTAIDRDARLYRARPRARRHMPALPHVPIGHDLNPTTTHQIPVRKRPEEPTLQHAKALEQSAPPSVLVDDTYQFVHLSPNAGRFILHTEGAFSPKLSDVVRPELRLDLRIALEHAIHKRTSSLTLATAVDFDSGPRRIAIQCSPVSGNGNEAEQALVVFLDAGPIADGDEPEIDPATVGAGEIRRLHGELRASQESLVASRAEHEIAIEDLRAANEELQSINEEYRSTSEELETSKEELQSMNEELQTVNAELKQKLESISTAHSDFQNLIAASEVGTLFLDTDLRIRMFTPPMTELFNITEVDVGRAITDFTSQLVYDSVEDDAQNVLAKLAPFESEVQSRDGRWFIIRIRPYRTIEDKINGVVFTFMDITSRRDTERRLEDSQTRYETLFNSIDEGFSVVNVLYEDDRAVDFRFVEVNAAFERQTGLPDVIGKTARELIPEHEEHWYDLHGRIAESGEPERFEALAEALGKYYDAYAFRVGTPEEHRVGMLFRDVSERKEAEEQREMLTAELSHRVKNTLAVVQALARSSGGRDQTVQQYSERLIGRIQALAKAHDQLLSTQWQSADLKTLIESIFSAYGGPGRRDLIAVQGPVVQLTPKQGLGLALVVHELATNASKYGSLSQKGGHLSLSWSREQTDQSEQVRLTWRETGGPEVQESASEGFGTKLIRQASNYELEGTVDFRFNPSGLEADIVFPIE